jgi:hypothetical protein
MLIAQTPARGEGLQKRAASRCSSHGATHSKQSVPGRQSAKLIRLSPPRFDVAPMFIDRRSVHSLGIGGSILAAALGVSARHCTENIAEKNDHDE